MPGTIAANPHQGTRSEYLAQYVFSAFGTSIPVPHPEDSGVDLYCTLGEIIGKKILVSDYFMVQVKSIKNHLTYSGDDEIFWVASHKYPLLFCFIDKALSRIEIYQSTRISLLRLEQKLESILLVPDHDAEDIIYSSQSREATVPLGKPILSFTVEQIADSRWVGIARNTLKSWVMLDQENIDLRSTGFRTFRFPQSYETNVPLNGLSRFLGTFYKLEQHDQRNVKFHDVLFRLLSQVLNSATADNDMDTFRSVAALARSLTDGKRVPDCWGHILFATCYNTAVETLRLPGGVTLTKADGTKHFFKAKGSRGSDV